MSVLVPLKEKYLAGHSSRFKSKTSNAGSGSKKRAQRANKSTVHHPKHAEWPRHIGGSWWGGKDKTRHQGG